MDTANTTKKPAAPDWEVIERDFRAGVLSIREIASLNGVSDTAIRKKAKKEGWERDLSAKVAEKVRSELVRAEVRAEKLANKETERQIVETAAATVVQVVREHRARIKQGSALTELLTKQLTDVAGKREEFEEVIEAECKDDQKSERRNQLNKAVSLGTHAAIAVSLAQAMKIWVALERQAFGLADLDTGSRGDDKPANDNTTAAREFADGIAARMAERINARRSTPAE